MNNVIQMSDYRKVKDKSELLGNLPVVNMQEEFMEQVTEIVDLMKKRDVFTEPKDE